MVGHQHVFVAYIAIHGEGFEHVDIAFIREHLGEVQEPALDIAEVDVEYLVSLTEVADYVVDLFSGIFEHFRYGALAEVEAVVRAFVHLDEFFEPFDCAHDASDPAIQAVANTGVLRVAGQLHFDRFGDRDDPAQEVVDAVPHFIGVGDIVEPITAWRDAKLEITGREWDYVFRRLFYAYTPDVTAQPFGERIEIANRDQTAGHIRNGDLHLDADGLVHILWTESNLDHRLRDRFFPDQQIAHTL